MKRKAFTLIELMVVVAIILILAASMAGFLHKAASKRSGATTDSGYPTQSPLNSSVAAPAPPEYNGTQFRISNPEDAKLMREALQRAGFKVETVTDKINLVYKPQ